MAKVKLMLKDNRILSLPLNEKIDIMSISTIIENRVENGSGNITGNIGIGTVVCDNQQISISDIISIEILFE